MSIALRSVLVLGVIGLAAGCHVPESIDRMSDRATYTNPVGDSLLMGDPFVLFHEGRYTLYGTTDPSVGFRAYTSTNLVDWEPIGFAYGAEPDGWATGPFWAPEVKEYQGRFYMTYSGRDRETNRLLTALAVSDRPEGPFVDLYAPWFDTGHSAIDSHIFVDEDERPYVYFSRNGMENGYSFGIIFGAPLNPDLSGLAGKPVLLMQAEQDWERINYAENRANEGAFVLKRGDRYIMTYSANHTFRPGYGIGVATATDPLGPWTKSPDNPIAGTDVDVGYSGAGHNSITVSPDGSEMFIVYHTHEDSAHPETQRRTVNIDRLEWTEGGVRVVGPTRSPQPLPRGARRR